MRKRLHSRALQMLLASTAGLGGALALSHPAAASGFGLLESSADALGDGFAGQPAKGYDASTVYTNPAGMALLDQDEIETGLSYIGPSAKFTGTSSNPETGGNVSGGDGHNAISAAASAAAYGVLVLAPDWRVGFSLTAPYGDRTSYPDDWVGRYEGLVSSITDINFGLALSYKVNDHLSIGGGPNFDYFYARLTQAINVPGLSAATGQDPVADVHGNDLGVGYNFGAMYQFDADTRVGIDYRSRIRHDIFGIQRVSVPAVYSVDSPLIAEILGRANSSATTSITLPDSLSGGIYRQITPRWAVMGSVQWTDWSLVNAVHITTTNNSVNTTFPENWRNTWSAGAGTNYMILDNVMLQTGFLYDESPVTDGNRTVRLPDLNHYDVGFGVQYKIRPNTTLAFAYGHVFTPGGAIHNVAYSSALTPPGTITGKYADSDNSATLGLDVRF